MRISGWASWLGGVFAVLLSCGDARAQAVWTKPLGSSGVPATPTTDISFNPTSPSVFVAQGTKIFAYNATSSGMGALKWTRDFTPDSPVNFPSPVPLKSNKTAVFFTTSTGKLFGINTSDGSNLWTPVDLRRTGHSYDQFLATPAVQLYAFSNAAYQSAVNDDLIFIPTRFSAASSSADDSSGNQVIAIAASTGAIRWRFNGSGNYAIDYASEGCALDYSTNLIYCAFNQPGGSSTQASLYALHTAVAASAPDTTILSWSTNAGPIHTRPTLRNGKVYVATYDGYLRALAPSTGTAGKIVWSQKAAASGSYLALNPLVETRAYSPFPNAIVTIDSTHNISYYDDTRSPSLIWTQTGTNATSMVASAPYSSRLYIGESDGSIHELRYKDGTETASYNVGPGTVYDPSIDNESNSNSSSGYEDGDHLFAVSGGTASTSGGVTTYSGSTIGLFPIPFVTYTGCYSAFGTTTCDGETSTGGGAGTAHACTGTNACGYFGFDANGNCSLNVTCASSTPTCCTDANNIPVCANTSTDADNCGGCGLDCATNTGCVNGVCTTCTASCSGATPHCNSSLNACVCSAIDGDTCTANKGSQWSCNTSTGACACTPQCNACVPAGGMPDGCGGTCATTCYAPQQGCNGSSCACVGGSSDTCKAFYGGNYLCNTSTGACGCTPTACTSCEPYGGVSNGCGGTCSSSCTKSQPACSGSSCVCTGGTSDTCKANLGANYSCNTSTGSCICTPTACPACTTTATTDGCGNACAVCSGTCVKFGTKNICVSSTGT